MPNNFSQEYFLEQARKLWERYTTVLSNNLREEGALYNHLFVNFLKEANYGSDAHILVTDYLLQVLPPGNVNNLISTIHNIQTEARNLVEDAKSRGVNLKLIEHFENLFIKRDEGVPGNLEVFRSLLAYTFPKRSESITNYIRHEWVIFDREIGNVGRLNNPDGTIFTVEQISHMTPQEAGIILFDLGSDGKPHVYTWADFLWVVNKAVQVRPRPPGPLTIRAEMENRTYLDLDAAMEGNRRNFFYRDMDDKIKFTDVLKITPGFIKDLVARKFKDESFREFLLAIQYHHSPYLDNDTYINILPITSIIKDKKLVKLLRDTFQITRKSKYGYNEMNLPLNPTTPTLPRLPPLTFPLKLPIGEWWTDSKSITLQEYYHNIWRRGFGPDDDNIGGDGVPRLPIDWPPENPFLDMTDREAWEETIRRLEEIENTGEILPDEYDPNDEDFDDEEDDTSNKRRLIEDDLEPVGTNKNTKYGMIFGTDKGGNGVRGGETKRLGNLGIDLPRGDEYGAFNNFSDLPSSHGIPKALNPNNEVRGPWELGETTESFKVRAGAKVYYVDALTLYKALVKYNLNKGFAELHTNDFIYQYSWSSHLLTSEKSNVKLQRAISLRFSENYIYLLGQQRLLDAAGWRTIFHRGQYPYVEGVTSKDTTYFHALGKGWEPILPDSPSRQIPFFIEEGKSIEFISSLLGIPTSEFIEHIPLPPTEQIPYDREFADKYDGAEYEIRNRIYREKGFPPHWIPSDWKKRGIIFNDLEQFLYHDSKRRYILEFEHRIYDNPEPAKIKAKMLAFDNQKAFEAAKGVFLSSMPFQIAQDLVWLQEYSISGATFQGEIDISSYLTWEEWRDLKDRLFTFFTNENNIRLYGNTLIFQEFYKKYQDVFGETDYSILNENKTQIEKLIRNIEHLLNSLPEAREVLTESPWYKYEGPHSLTDPHLMHFTPPVPKIWPGPFDFEIQNNLVNTRRMLKAFSLDSWFEKEVVHSHGLGNILKNKQLTALRHMLRAGDPQWGQLANLTIRFIDKGLLDRQYAQPLADFLKNLIKNASRIAKKVGWDATPGNIAANSIGDRIIKSQTSINILEGLAQNTQESLLGSEQRNASSKDRIAMQKNISALRKYLPETITVFYTPDANKMQSAGAAGTHTKLVYRPTKGVLELSYIKDRILKQLQDKFPAPSVVTIEEIKDFITNKLTTLEVNFTYIHKWLVQDITNEFKKNNQLSAGELPSVSTLLNNHYLSPSQPVDTPEVPFENYEHTSSENTSPERYVVTKWEQVKNKIIERKQLRETVSLNNGVEIQKVISESVKTYDISEFYYGKVLNRLRNSVFSIGPMIGFMAVNHFLDQDYSSPDRTKDEEKYYRLNDEQLFQLGQAKYDLEKNYKSILIDPITLDNLWRLFVMDHDVGGAEIDRLIKENWTKFGLVRKNKEDPIGSPFDTTPSNEFNYEIQFNINALTILKKLTTYVNTNTIDDVLLLIDSYLHPERFTKEQIATAYKNIGLTGSIDDFLHNTFGVAFLHEGWNTILGKPKTASNGALIRLQEVLLRLKGALNSHSEPGKDDIFSLPNVMNDAFPMMIPVEITRSISKNDKAFKQKLKIQLIAFIANLATAGRVSAVQNELGFGGDSLNTMHVLLEKLLVSEEFINGFMAPDPLEWYNKSTSMPKSLIEATKLLAIANNTEDMMQTIYSEMFHTPEFEDLLHFDKSTNRIYLFKNYDDKIRFFLLKLNTIKRSNKMDAVGRFFSFLGTDLLIQTSFNELLDQREHMYGLSDEFIKDAIKYYLDDVKFTQRDMDTLISIIKFKRKNILSDSSLDFTVIPQDATPEQVNTFKQQNKQLRDAIGTSSEFGVLEKYGIISTNEATELIHSYTQRKNVAIQKGKNTEESNDRITFWDKIWNSIVDKQTTIPYPEQLLEKLYKPKSNTTSAKLEVLRTTYPLSQFSPIYALENFASETITPGNQPIEVEVTVFKDEASKIRWWQDKKARLSEVAHNTIKILETADAAIKSNWEVNKNNLDVVAHKIISQIENIDEVNDYINKNKTRMMREVGDLEAKTQYYKDVARLHELADKENRSLEESKEFSALYKDIYPERSGEEWAKFENSVFAAKQNLGDSILYGTMSRLYTEIKEKARKDLDKEEFDARMSDSFREDKALYAAKWIHDHAQQVMDAKVEKNNLQSEYDKLMKKSNLTDDEKSKLTELARKLDELSSLINQFNQVLSSDYSVLGRKEEIWNKGFHGATASRLTNRDIAKDVAQKIKDEIKRDGHSTTLASSDASGARKLLKQYGLWNDKLEKEYKYEEKKLRDEINQGKILQAEIDRNNAKLMREIAIDRERELFRTGPHSPPGGPKIRDKKPNGHSFGCTCSSCKRERARAEERLFLESIKKHLKELLEKQRKEQEERERSTITLSPEDLDAIRNGKYIPPDNVVANAIHVGEVISYSALVAAKLSPLSAIIPVVQQNNIIINSVNNAASNAVKTFINNNALTTVSAIDIMSKANNAITFGTNGEGYEVEGHGTLGGGEWGQTPAPIDLGGGKKPITPEDIMKNMKMLQDNKVFFKKAEWKLHPGGSYDGSDGVNQGINSTAQAKKAAENKKGGNTKSVDPGLTSAPNKTLDLPEDRTKQKDLANPGDKTPANPMDGKKGYNPFAKNVGF